MDNGKHQAYSGDSYLQLNTICNKGDCWAWLYSIERREGNITKCFTQSKRCYRCSVDWLGWDFVIPGSAGGTSLLPVILFFDVIYLNLVWDRQMVRTISCQPFIIFVTFLPFSDHLAHQVRWFHPSCFVVISDKIVGNHKRHQTKKKVTSDVTLQSYLSTPLQGGNSFHYHQSVLYTSSEQMMTGHRTPWSTTPVGLEHHLSSRLKQQNHNPAVDKWQLQTSGPI